MKYQLFSTTILDTMSTDSTSHEFLENGKIYQSFLEKFNSKKAAQKRASEILRKGEFKMVDCSVRSVTIFKRFAKDLKTKTNNN